MVQNTSQKLPRTYKICIDYRKKWDERRKAGKEE